MEEKQLTSNILLNRLQRNSAIHRQIIDILKSEENLAIADIQKKIVTNGAVINRNTLNHYIDKLVKEGWFMKRTIKCEGEDKRGSPKTLVMTKKQIKELKIMKKMSAKAKGWSFEEYNLKSILSNKILEEIGKQQSSEKQHQNLIEMFKKFGKEGYGAKIIFLLYSNFIKIDYKLFLTDKGKKELEKIEKQPEMKKEEILSLSPS
jgi:DNA-binding MarR family transcriptional regulator